MIANLHQTTSQEEILILTVEEARRLLACERAVVYRLSEPSRGTVIAEAIIPGWTKTIAMTIEEPCLGAKELEMYQQGRVKALDDIYNSGLESSYLKQLEEIEVKASLVAPIRQQGKLFGLLVAHQCSQPRQWQPSEIECLSQLAMQAGLTLNQAELRQESARIKELQGDWARERAELRVKREQHDRPTATETQWTQLFTQAVVKIRQSLQPKDLLKVTVEEVRRALKCERVVVCSLNQDQDGVVIAESVALGWTRALGITIKDSCFESRYVEKYRDGRVRALDNLEFAGMNACYLEQLEKLEVKANLVVPIIKEENLFGLLIAHQCSVPRQWQQEEIRWVRQIAIQVGLALENAKLLQELKQSSLNSKTISFWQQQPRERIARPVSELVVNSPTSYQALSQKALQQSETVMDVLAQCQEMSDVVRSQIVDLQQVKGDEERDSLKRQELQATLTQIVVSMAAIEEEVNDAVLKLRQLNQSSSQLLALVHLIQNVGEQLARQSRQIILKTNKTESIPADYVVELTDKMLSVLSSRQQLCAAVAPIHSWLLTIETVTRDEVTALERSKLELAKETDTLQDIQHELNRMTLDSVNKGWLVEQIARAAENQLQVAVAVRQSLQEVGNLNNRVWQNYLTLLESFNRLSALTEQL